MASSVTQNPTSSPSISRRPYRGSCHCGHTRYVAFLSFPPIIDPHPKPKSSICIYKCNCSTCLKAGFFHVRLKDSPNDFFLLSPLNPETGGLGDYTCFSESIHWFFCKQCGVRCFAIVGEGETREVDARELGEEGGEGGETMTKVWTPKAEGWVENRTGYLSVNAATLEPGQDGLSLKEWTEKGWICYHDGSEYAGDARFGEPHIGGIY